MPYIQFEKTNSVATIRFNRPDKLNSFNREMSDELLSALKKCEDDEIRSVYITGNGRGFCAGQDLSEAVGEYAYEIEDIVDKQYNPIIKKIRNLKKPVICGVNGVAAGAGANISFACDITFASDEAVFIQSFSKIGLIPDSGGTFMLPRLIGMQRAAALAFTGEKIDAKTAKEYGLIYEVCPSDKLDEIAGGLAEKLSYMPTKGIALTKKAFNKSQNNSLDEQLKIEKKLQKQASETEDYNEGVSAFLEKRKPNYKGK